MAWNIEGPVLVPYDFSAHSDAAVERALEITNDASRVRVLHVLPEIIPTEPGVVWGTVDDQSRIEHTLRALAEKFPAEKHGSLDFQVKIGDAGSVAAQVADELGTDLIVLGSQGRTGLSRMVLGSVAERVARLANCPVLIMKLSAH